jgi:hypothetical protein
LAALSRCQYSDDFDWTPYGPVSIENVASGAIE